MESAGNPYKMRSPCKECGAVEGRIERKSNQDVVRCAQCDRYAYCAPRVETGLPVEPPKPMKLVSKFDGLCTICGRAYSVGDRIWWTRGMQGARCLTCGAAR